MTQSVMLESLKNLEPEVTRATESDRGNVCALETNCWCAGTAEARPMHRILRRNLWCVLPKIGARFRRFVSRAIAEFSPPLGTTMASMKFLRVRWRHSASRAMCSSVLPLPGKSKNVIRALQEAKARELKTIAFLGRDGGSTVGIADLDLLVKSDSTARVQEAHQLLLHVLCEIIESRLDKR